MKVRSVSRKAFQHVVSWFVGPHRIIAVVIFLAFAALILGEMLKSFRQERLDRGLIIPPLIQPKSYRLIFDSVDESSRIAHVRADFVYDKTDLSYAASLILPGEKDPTLSLEADELAREFGKRPDAVHVFFDGFAIDDLSDPFNVNGLEDAQGRLEVQRELHKEKLPGPASSEAVPTFAEKNLSLLGDPKLYPFDGYLLVGQIRSNALATTDGKTYLRLPGESYTIELRIPGFVIRGARADELENWNTISKQLAAIVKQNEGQNSEVYKQILESAKMLSGRYRPDLWSSGGFALKIERPFFLKFSACFLGVVALLSTFYIVRSSEPKMLLLNAVGYFIGLWAFREALAAWEPKMPTLVDYALMGLYAFLVMMIFSKFLWQGVEKANRQGQT